MARKRGYTLVIVGLILGLVAGFVIKEIKRQIGVNLADLLENEAFSSSGCHFVTDQISVSLLLQRAVATNPRIECNGIAHLQFKEIIAGFHIARIRHHIIDLDLDLISGSSQGFLPQSTTFKFIDSLAAPIAPERDRPDRYRVKLQHLSVSNLDSKETIGDATVFAHGASLLMSRTASDDFQLAPSIPTINISRGKHTFTIKDLATELYLKDSAIELRHLTTSGGLIAATGDLAIPYDSAREMQGNMIVSAALEQFSNKLKGRIDMPLIFNGSLNSPTISGKLNSTGLTLNERVATSQLQGNFIFDITHGLQIKSLGAAFDFGTIALKEPIIFAPERASGEALLTLAQPLSGQALITVGGTRAHPSAMISGSATSSDQVSLTAHLLATDLLDTPQLKGDGSLTAPRLPQLDVTLQPITSELVKVSVTGAEKSINGAAILNFFDGSGQLDLTMSSALVAQQVPCGILNSSLAYKWVDNAIKAGSGKLHIESMSGGCALSATTLQEPVDIPITNGSLRLKDVAFVSLGKPLLVDGTIDTEHGFDVHASGLLDLAALSPLAPTLDELSGLGEGKITVTGSLASPNLSGTVALRNVLVEQAKAGISISNLSGPIAISNNVIAFQELKGICNDGNVTISGNINLTNLPSSQARVQAEHLSFEPSANLSLIVSGDLLLAQPQGRTVVSGTLSLDSGEYSDTITISQILKIIEQTLVNRRLTSANTLPEIELNLSITGSRNLYVITNLGSAELATNLKVAGTLKNPLVTGEITFRSGWIGFQNRRFEINAGRLIFTPPNLEPLIDLNAETILPARSGENVLVILQGRGPVTSPKISLTSDQPIAERDLLALVSAGGAFSSQTRVNTLGLNNPDDAKPLLEELAQLHLRTFFSNLVDVDSLAIAPIFNPRTGLVEPAIVAEKLLARSLTLFGESTLSGVEGISRARLQLDLSDKLAAGALIEEDPSQSGVPAELQLTYTPLSRQSRRVNVRLIGNKQISDSAILRNLRLSNISFITPQDAVALETQLKGFYASEGFAEMTVAFSCEQYQEACTSIALVINEGEAQQINSVFITGDELPVEITQSIREKILKIRRDQRRSESFKTSKIKALVRALRTEGYVAARVDGTFICDEPLACVLQLSVQVGKPISFIFSGNTIFSPSDFLNAIRLFDRTQPFGNNTISVLLSTIERMYRERGFLLATVTHQQKQDATGRTTYKITIEEGKQIRVERIEIDLPSDVLAQALKLLSLEQRDSLEHPQFLIDEEVEDNASNLQSSLKSLGYISATVEGKILPIVGDSAQAVIQYHVDLGPKSAAVPAIIHGWPSTLRLPSTLTASDFPEKLSSNRKDEITKALQEAGYLGANVRQNTEDHFEVDPGERATIHEIHIAGNRTISERVIANATKLKHGDPLVQANLDAARLRLLKLGLFSRVSVSTTPSGLVNIEVLERAPQSVELGAGVNSEFGLHLFGEASDRELFGDGRQLALRLDGYYDTSVGQVSKGTASAQFRVPLVFRSDLGLSEDLRFQRFDLATLPFDLDRWSLASFLNGEHDEWTYSFGHTVLVDRLDNVASDARLSEFDTGSTRLGFISGTVSYDNRDAPLNPQSGALFAVDTKLASQAFGSEANFFEVTPHLSWSTPLTLRWGLGYQLRAGISSPFGGTDEVPITQRYFLGGRTTVRGFKENSIGPRGELGSELGGRYLGNQNLELRYKPANAVAFLWFIDSGSVFLHSPSIDDVRHSTGLGVRYLSPVGPIGFDVGFPLERRSDEDPYRIHFSIGTIF